MMWFCSIILIFLKIYRIFGLDIDRIIGQVDSKFLSVAVDSHLVGEQWKNFDFNSKRLVNLASALHPAYLRLGGTAADLVVFKEKASNFLHSKVEAREQCSRNSIDCYCTTSTVCEDLGGAFYKNRTNITLTGQDWMKINLFSMKVGWTFLFDVNVLRRKGHNWSPRNARKLIKFSSALGYKNIAWELGNEPNALKHQLGVKVPGKQLGKDFKKLRKLLNKFPLYANSTLVGPDVNHIRDCMDTDKRKTCKALKYLKKVYKGSGGKNTVLDAITWHHYYLNGHIAKLEDFLQVNHLKELGYQFDIVEKYLKSIHLFDRPLWLGETSSAYGGGAKGLSDRYVACFLWLDKLGLAAVHNYQVVIRQTFYHGNYALIGEDLLPNPDFWISALYKLLVGNKVLSLSKENDKLPDTVRLYAHCGKQGGVVLFGLNMDRSDQVIHLGSSLYESNMCSFKLNPSNGLTGRGITLNEQLLELKNDEFLPNLLQMGICYASTKSLRLGPYEMAFWHFPDIVGHGCF